MDSSSEKSNSLISRNEESKLDSKSDFVTTLLFWLKIISIIVLLISALQYLEVLYPIFKIVICGTAVFSAFNYYKANKKGWAWIFGIIAVLHLPQLPLNLFQAIYIHISIVLLFFISMILLDKFPYDSNE